MKILSQNLFLRENILSYENMYNELFWIYSRHIGDMWRQSYIQPIVYTLNSPNEKRYFQQTLHTQYLTDSLRSEPSNFVKSKKWNVIPLHWNSLSPFEIGDLICTRSTDTTTQRWWIYFKNSLQIAINRLKN